MKNWVLSIGSIVILTSIISIIFPEGRLAKNVKSVFSLIIVLAIIQPIASVKDLDISTILDSSGQELQLQEDFIYYVAGQKITNYQKQCQNILEEQGISKATISINYIVNDKGQAVINNVIVDLQNAVIYSNKEHIDIIKEITAQISTILNIDNKLVIFNE